MMTMRTFAFLTAALCSACGVDVDDDALASDERFVPVARIQGTFNADGTVELIELPLEELNGSVRQQGFILPSISFSSPAAPDTLGVRNSTRLGAGATAANPQAFRLESPATSTCGAVAAPGTNSTIRTFGLNIENNLEADVANVVLRVNEIGADAQLICHANGATRLPVAQVVPGGRGLATFQFGPLANRQTIDTASLTSPIPTGDGVIGVRLPTSTFTRYTFSGDLFVVLP